MLSIGIVTLSETIEITPTGVMAGYLNAESKHCAVFGESAALSVSKGKASRRAVVTMATHVQI